MTLHTDGDVGTIEARVLSYGVVDYGRDIVLAGAIPQNTAVVVGSYGHGSVMRSQPPIGRGVVASDSRHAYLKAKLFLGTRAGRDAHELLREMGDLQEWSIGFDVGPGDTEIVTHDDGQPVRVIHSMRLLEVSPVLAGMSPGTGTITAKTGADVLTEEYTRFVLFRARTERAHLRDDLRAIRRRVRAAA